MGLDPTVLRTEQTSNDGWKRIDGLLERKKNTSTLPQSQASQESGGRWIFRTWSPSYQAVHEHNWTLLYQLDGINVKIDPLNY